MTPTLSQIQNWDVEHLSQAATFWRNTAEVWDSAFTRVNREIRSPGQTTWIGAGADAALVRSELDKQKVHEAAVDLVSMAAFATNWATDLAAAKAAVLLAIGEAVAEGFRVNEDLSVEDRHIADRFPTEFHARRTLAESLAAIIRERASALTTIDSAAAQRISALAAHLTDMFPAPGTGASATNVDPSIQLVDNRTFAEGPMYPEPGIEPGTGGPGPGAGAEAIREALRSLPTGSSPRILEVRDMDQLRQFSHWATASGQEVTTSKPYRGGSGSLVRLPDGTLIGRGESVKHGLSVDVHYPDGRSVRLHVNPKTGGDISMPRGAVPEPARLPEARPPSSIRPGLAGPPQFSAPGVAGAGYVPVLPAVPDLVERPEQSP